MTLSYKKNSTNSYWLSWDNSSKHTKSKRHNKSNTCKRKKITNLSMPTESYFNKMPNLTNNLLIVNKKILESTNYYKKKLIKELSIEGKPLKYKHLSRKETLRYCNCKNSVTSTECICKKYRGDFRIWSKTNLYPVRKWLLFRIKRLISNNNIRDCNK